MSELKITDSVLNLTKDPTMPLTMSRMKSQLPKAYDNLPSYLRGKDTLRSGNISDIASRASSILKDKDHANHDELLVHVNAQKILTAEFDKSMSNLLATSGVKMDWNTYSQGKVIWNGPGAAKKRLLSKEFLPAPTELKNGVSTTTEGLISAGLDILSMTAYLGAVAADGYLTIVTDGLWALSPIQATTLVDYWTDVDGVDLGNVLTDGIKAVTDPIGVLDSGVHAKDTNGKKEGKDTVRNARAVINPELVFSDAVTRPEPVVVTNTTGVEETQPPTDALDVLDEDSELYERLKKGLGVSLAQFVNLNPHEGTTQPTSIRLPIVLDSLGLNILAPLGCDIGLTGLKDEYVYSNSAFARTRRDMVGSSETPLEALAAKYLFAVPLIPNKGEDIDREAVFNLEIERKLFQSQEACSFAKLEMGHPCNIGYVGVSFEDTWFTVNEGILVPLFIDDSYETLPLLMHEPIHTPVTLNGGRLGFTAYDQPNLEAAYGSIFTHPHKWDNHVPRVKSGVSMMKLRVMCTPSYRVIVGIMQLTTKMKALSCAKRDVSSKSIEMVLDEERMHLRRVPLLEDSIPLTDEGLRADISLKNPKNGRFDPNLSMRAPLGDRIMLAGKTGAGKTVKAMLITQWANTRGKDVVWVMSDEPDSPFTKVLHAPQYADDALRESVTKHVNPSLVAELHAVNIQSLDGLVFATRDRLGLSEDRELIMIVDSMTSVLSAGAVEGQSNQTMSGGVNPATRKTLVDWNSRHYENTTIIGVVNIPIDKTGTNLQLRTQLMGAMDVYYDQTAHDASQLERGLSFYRSRSYGVMNNIAHFVEDIVQRYPDGTVPDLDFEALQRDFPEAFSAGNAYGEGRGSIRNAITSWNRDPHSSVPSQKTRG